MGIKDWFKVFGLSGRPIKEKEFKGKNLGIDASYDIFRASLGMKNVRGLTDRSGNPTAFLNTLVHNLAKYKKIGVAGLIYIFDHPDKNPFKLKETKKRRDKREIAKAKLNATTGGHPQLEKQCFSITSSMINDVKKVLDLLGIPWIDTPFKFEAEHLGAELSRKGIIDSLITSDSDTLLFGGVSMVRRVKTGKKTSYEEYTLADTLVDYDLTREQLVHLGVVMGSDFNTKTPGIGPKTILLKGPNVELASEQKAAAQYFLAECPFSNDQIHTYNRTPKEKGEKREELINWLVDEKNFNRVRVTRALTVFT